MPRWFPPILLLGLLLGGCATVPPAALSKGVFSPVTPQEIQTGTPEGQRIRWGGVIIDVTPKEQETCFRILALPLDTEARPERDDRALGRFVGCAQGFYDPALYAVGREITVTGEIRGVEPGKVGDFQYLFPRVAVDAVYLWPKQPNVVHVPYRDPFFWSPFWWDPFYSPWYWPPPRYYRR